MNQMFDVFISYRRSDGAELAKAVRDYLMSRGLRVFLDTRELIDGQFFDTQLPERVIETPNYVLIATPDAFKFRDGEDWVREEIKLAVSEFKKNPQDRSVIPFVPNGTVFPESGLPEGLEDLPRFNRILLKDTKPTGAELLRLAKAICRVNRRNMWNAGQRVLERSKAEGSRFHLLHVDERIMPLYKKDKRAKAQGATLPINVTSGESKEESSLRDALQAQQGSLYLIGEGGIGKTTAMISIMERRYTDQSYSDSGEIPIFVELNGAPKSAKWYQGEDGLASDFIRREIARLFLGVNSIGKVAKDYISGMDALFTEETDTPEYLLLLDGLNEVSTDYVSDENGRSQPIRSLIIEEINYLLAECPNVRVMLTSRTDETEINCSEHGIEKLYLTGLHKDSITEYLESKKFSSREIKDALADERLFDCIRIPLFLTMFAALNKTKGVSSRGEIFSRFFHERSDELQSEYTQKNRLDSLKKDTVNKGQLRFILDFLLPAIGCEMERWNDFKLTAEEAAKIILPILEGKDANGNKPEKTAHPCAVIGEYGKQCFSGYKGSASLPKIAALLLSVSDDISEVAEYILTSAVDILGILYRDDNAEYGFIHHHFRDYFAAVHDINLLRIAVQANTKKKSDLAFESLASFISNANRREKSIFIGEILGEHHNKPYLKGKIWQYNVPTSPEDRNLLKRALDIFRGRFGEEVGYGVFSLIDPIKYVRQDLLGGNLLNLDLTYISFNGMSLGNIITSNTNLQKSKIRMENLLNKGHSSCITSIAYVSTSNTILSGSFDRTIKEWSVITGQCIQTFYGHELIVNSIAVAPDERTFISGSRDSTIKEWDRITGKCVRTYAEHKGDILSVAYAPDGKSFISGAEDESIKEWDIVTGNCIRTYKGHRNGVYTVVYSPDAKTILSGGVDGQVKEWDRNTGECIRSYGIWHGTVNRIVFSNDFSTLLLGCEDGTIVELNRVTGHFVNTYKGNVRGINTVTYSPDGNYIISGAGTSNDTFSSNNTTIFEWDRNSGQCIKKYSHCGWVTSIIVFPHGNSFVSGGGDGVLIEWNRTTGNIMSVFRNCNVDIRLVSFEPNNRLFLMVPDNSLSSNSSYIVEWDSLQFKCTHIYIGHKGGIISIDYSKDGKSFISGSYDKTIKEWDIATGQCIRSYEGHTSTVECVAYAPDSNTIISGSDDNTIKEWDRATGECVRTYETGNLKITSVLFAANGKTIIFVTGDNAIKEMDRVTGQCIHTYEGHSHWVTCISYAPDGKTFISGSLDNTIKEWDRATGQCICTYEGHRISVSSVAFAPDGKTFLSGSWDNTVRVWDRATGQCLRMCKGHSNFVNSVAFATDGKTFLSGSADGTARVWSTETGECLKVIRNYPGLIVLGCDMRNLHEGSDIDKDLLRQYGAIVD